MVDGMKFELDQDYFNRAGDKVRYVGFGPGGFYYFRESKYMTLYEVDSDGRYNHERGREYDILGKWEITDDLDRVYITVGGKELKAHGILKIGENKTFMLKDVEGCSYQYYSNPNLCLTDMQIQKILIKPQGTLNKMIGRDFYLYQRTDKTELHELKKIEPLSNSFMGSFVDEYKNKINEIIERLNS